MSAEVLTFDEATTVRQIREVLGFLGAAAARLCELELVIVSIESKASDDEIDEVRTASHLLSKIRRTVGEAWSSADVCVMREPRAMPDKTPVEASR